MMAEDEEIYGKSVAIQAIDTLRSAVEDLITAIDCDQWTVSQAVTDQTSRFLRQACEALDAALNAIYNAEESLTDFVKGKR